MSFKNYDVSIKISILSYRMFKFLVSSLVSLTLRLLILGDPVRRRDAVPFRVSVLVVFSILQCELAQSGASAGHHYFLSVTVFILDFD